MITWKTVRDALRFWANTETTQDVIWAKQNGIQLEYPFLTLNIGALNRINIDYQGAPHSTSGISIISGDREFMLTVESYGVGHYKH